MVQTRVMNGIVGRVTPEAFLSVFQMRYNTVSLAFVDAACGGGEEARLATYEQVASGGIAGAELTGALKKSRIGAQAVALAVVDGAAAYDKRGRNKQGEHGHDRARSLGARAALAAAPLSHSRAVPRPPPPGLPEPLCPTFPETYSGSAY